MTSRIFVDIRGDGANVADALTRLGFIVQELIPSRCNKDGYHCEQSLSSGSSKRLLRAVFSENAPVWGSNHQSLDLSKPLPSGEEANYLLQSLRR